MSRWYPHRFQNVRFDLCAGLLEQAKKEPTLDLLSCYCDLLCGVEFLLGREAEEGDPDEEESILLQYLNFCQERKVLRQTMEERMALDKNFLAVKNEKRDLHPVNCDIKHIYQIVTCFTKLFQLPAAMDGSILLDNLTAYAQIAACSLALKSVEPLLMFRLLTKHKSRMCKVPDLNVRLSALWKRDNITLTHDNGRNFKQARTQLEFFRQLCQIYQNDASVDLPLCWYGLEQLTPLAEFYQAECAPGWSYADDEDEYPFPHNVEDLVNERLFTCFENGFDDLVLLEDSDITFQELMRFQDTEHPIHRAAITALSDYMDRDPTLIERFAQANRDQVKAMCQDIFSRAPFRYQPSSPRETALFLSVINQALMDRLDQAAEGLLIQTGYALLYRPTQTFEQPGSCPPAHPAVGSD